MERLPFKSSLGDDVPFSNEQWDWLLNMVYDSQEVFSFHDESLRFCDQLAHTLLTMTDRPVYLLHRTIPCQLQGKVGKCLDTWLKLGIIWPSEAICFSNGYIKKNDQWNLTLHWLLEIKFNSGQGCFSLTVHYLHWRLSITVNGSFPLIWCKGTFKCPLLKQT